MKARDILKRISRADVLWAIDKASREGVPGQRESVRYSLLHEGETYPPKYILGLAATRVAGRSLEPEEHSGGAESNDLLTILGFEIVARRDAGDASGPTGEAADADQTEVGRGARVPRVWRVIAHHENPDDAIRWQMDHGRIAVGWGDTGNLAHETPEDVAGFTNRIREAYPEAGNAMTGGPSLWRLVRSMRVGDLAIIAGGGSRRHVVEITGPYEWRRDADAMGDYFHQREAVPTEHDADRLWRELGATFAEGESPRWTVALCGTSDAVDEKTRTYVEGRRVELRVSAKERNPKARQECLDRYGPSCVVCGMSFEKRYGPGFVGGIHVHHLHPMADIEQESEVHPVRDLRPLCPNCHAAVHQRSPPWEPEELRAHMRRAAEAASDGDPLREGEHLG